MSVCLSVSLSHARTHKYTERQTDRDTHTLSLSLCVSLSHSRTHTNRQTETHTHTHARTQTHTHTHTHTHTNTHSPNWPTSIVLRRRLSLAELYAVTDTDLLWTVRWEMTDWYRSVVNCSVRTDTLTQTPVFTCTIALLKISSRAAWHFSSAQVDTPQIDCTSRHTTDWLHKSTHHGLCAQVDTPRIVCTSRQTTDCVVCPVDVASCRNSYCQSNRYTLLSHRVLAEPKMGLLRTWLLSVSEKLGRAIGTRKCATKMIHVGKCILHFQVNAAMPCYHIRAISVLYC